MRCMVIVKADRNTEDGMPPDAKLLADMGGFNEELVKAGIMLSGDGVRPSKEGVRVRFDGDRRTVIDGPFAETKELVAGFWIWQVKSLDEAIAWVKRCPNPTGEQSVIEIRPLYEAADFGEDIAKQDEALRAKIEHRV